MDKAKKMCMDSMTRLVFPKTRTQKVISGVAYWASIGSLAYLLSNAFLM